MNQLESLKQMMKNSILIVDDEKSNLLVLNSILGADYTLYMARDGWEAVERANEYLPDLILLDIVMPGMDGYEVLSLLKNSEKTKEIPVIFISGLGSGDDEEKGLSLGADDYIAKPFREAIIQLRVRNQIRSVNQMRLIERLSMIDKLTELPNRRSFDKQLSAECRRAIRDSLPISILMIDIDKFKVYNDTYGHQQGDVALATIAKIMSQTLKRAGDFPSRWGGEEFAVILSSPEKESAITVADMLRSKVERAEIPCPDGTITKLTISVGVNTQTPTQSDTAEDFIAKADKALYAAKKGGRNRVCHF